MPLNSEAGLIIYTDGSCHYADRVGGWAAAITDGVDWNYHGGTEHDTTISRMELQAAIEGLRKVLEHYGRQYVLVISDSQYVVSGATDPKRKRRRNIDLWLELDEAILDHKAVDFEHVKGHNGNKGNEIADRLAGEFRQAGLHSANPFA